MKKDLMSFVYYVNESFPLQVRMLPYMDNEESQQDIRKYRNKYLDLKPFKVGGRGCLVMLVNRLLKNSI
ncbi:MAG: hypothetical protein ACTTJH_02010 [Bacteroidales bacterium]